MRELAPDVLRHRLVLSYEALADNVTPDDIIERILAAVPLPELPLGAHERGEVPVRATHGHSRRLGADDA